MLAEMFCELLEDLPVVNLRTEYIVRVHYLLFPFFQLILWHISVLTVLPTVHQILWLTLHIIIITSLFSFTLTLGSLKCQKSFLNFLQHEPIFLLLRLTLIITTGLNTTPFSPMNLQHYSWLGG